MINATIKKSAALFFGVFLLVGFTVDANAQSKPVMSEDGFIFFINGANVQIPTVQGTITVDPLDPTSGNRVLEIPYADYSENGFRWPSGGQRDTVGVDASAYTGINYGESDTLYVRIKSDTANIGKSDFIAFLDTDFDTNAPIPDGTDTTVVVNEDADLPFRLRWTIPAWVHDGQWHDLVIPLPPSTLAQLDSAKAGKNYDGTDLGVTVDSLFMNWNYAGAWANTSTNGHWDPSDPYWTEFDWESVKYFGRHADHNTGGASIYFDYFSIGVPPADLVDSPPAAVVNVSGSSTDGVNTVTWDEVAGSGGYRIYFGESAITDVTAAGVANIGSVAFDATRSLSHSITAPHPSLAEDFGANYAVTALSQFGSESAPTSVEVVGDAKVTPNFVVELVADDIDAIYDTFDDYSYPDGEAISLSGDDIKAMFPDTYQPFHLSKDNVIINGNGGDGDADISGDFWIGFGSDLEEFIVYAEIKDNALLFANSQTNASSGAWAFDSWEIGIGNYTPASFIISTTHSSFQTGDEPDYQFRGGRFDDRSPFAHVNGSSGAHDGEVPNSQTIAETTADGYRLLTVINTNELPGLFSGDDAFDFPTGSDFNLYPFAIALNDADDPATNRDTQLGWSNRIDESVDDWWNNPTRWQTIAFTGLDAAYDPPTANEDEPGARPFEFALDQNYPNPFNPTTKISFTLASTADVTLEVYNLLGQKVATLLQNEKMTAGKYTQTFNAGSLASGMYFYRISTPTFVKSRKMMLIK